MTDTVKTPETIYYFVDEAGDPILFSKKGKVLVGGDGCSNFFILGKLDIEETHNLEKELEVLRSQLLSDPYFKDVPSMQPENKKTAIAFHAKDDLPEVRREVFKVLQKHPITFYAVVRDKTALLNYVKQQNQRDASYRFQPNELYDTLVKELFRGFRRASDMIKICFAKRGNKNRTEALKQAIQKADVLFEQSFGFSRGSDVSIESSTPPQSVGLQAVDYFLWALQRFYERREERYIEMLWNQVGEINDIDLLVKKRRGFYFRKDKPLNRNTRPLENIKNPEDIGSKG